MFGCGMFVCFSFNYIGSFLLQVLVPNASVQTFGIGTSVFKSGNKYNILMFDTWRSGDAGHNGMSSVPLVVKAGVWVFSWIPYVVRLCWFTPLSLNLFVWEAEIMSSINPISICLGLTFFLTLHSFRIDFWLWQNLRHIYLLLFFTLVFIVTF